MILLSATPIKELFKNTPTIFNISSNDKRPLLDEICIYVHGRKLTNF